MVIYRREIQRDEVFHITGMGEMRPKWVFLCPILPKVHNNPKLAKHTCFLHKGKVFEFNHHLQCVFMREAGIRI